MSAKQRQKKKAENQSDDLLAIQLFEIGLAAAIKCNPQRYQSSSWNGIDTASREGMRAIAKHVFDNFNLKDRTDGGVV